MSCFAERDRYIQPVSKASNIERNIVFCLTRLVYWASINLSVKSFKYRTQHKGQCTPCHRPCPQSWRGLRLTLNNCWRRPVEGLESVRSGLKIELFDFGMHFFFITIIWQWVSSGQNGLGDDFTYFFILGFFTKSKRERERERNKSSNGAAAGFLLPYFFLRVTKTVRYLSNKLSLLYEMKWNENYIF